MDIKLLSKNEKDKELKTIKRTIIISIINSIVSVLVFIYIAMISTSASTTTFYIILALTIGTTVITGVNLNNSLKSKELTLDAYSLSLSTKHLNMDITEIKSFGTEHKKNKSHIQLITHNSKYIIHIKDDVVMSCTKEQAQ